MFFRRLRPSETNSDTLSRRKAEKVMGKLTGTRHGDAANELLGFYTDKVRELEQSGQYFMAGVALALAVETAVLTYLLVEFGEDNGGELEIPDSVNMSELIEAANEIDVLNAPINVPSHARTDDDETPPKHVAKDVVEKIRRFRNLIHPARALKKSFNPQTFTHEQLIEFKEMYDSVVHSLLYYL
jgi:phosphohistidine phosphatase SixA